MRLALALVVAFIVAACAVEQSSSGGGFVLGDSARAAQVAYDAEVILQGVDQARDSTRRVARDIHPADPGAAQPSVTR
jgi:uncharacterized cupredoxin-like copper-binding protein